MDYSRRTFAAGVAAAGLVPWSTATAQTAMASPESVGFSSAGLQKLDQVMHGLVDQRLLAGVVTLVARRGKVVHHDAYGRLAAPDGAPVAKDSIFRIASMTKPIVGVAMMMLWEEGKWTLDDPVAKHIPQFANLKVSGPGGTQVAQDHPMTMRELMSHTAGFDVSAGYNGAGLNATDLQGMVDKLAALPLAAQPGSDWRYGPSVDIQGYIVEKLSGQGLDVFLSRRIFEPLGMKDTGFWVDPAKATRLSRVHRYEPGGVIGVAPATGTPTAKPRFLSGSGGLFSTAEDYWRFCQMLLNGGQSGGRRYLRPATVALMHRNVLRPGVMVDLYRNVERGIGFGLDFAIIQDPEIAGMRQGRGTYYWGGAFGTWFWIDPVNEIVVVGMIQNNSGSTPTAGTPPVRMMSARAIYDALAKRG